MPSQQSTLFGADQLGDTTNVEQPERGMPLAARMRPLSLDEVIGQEHLIAPGHVLRRAIEADRLPSMILWGPPGSGKTTLAEVIAHTTRSRFVGMSAVTTGVAELRRVVEDSAKLRRATGQRTLLFLDEIHRFNKSQQDSALPHVERGTVTLIGATTENPSLGVNAALLSRCQVFALYALKYEHICTILQRTLRDSQRGLGDEQLAIDEDALAFIATLANGDARTALTALELIAGLSPLDAAGTRRITLAMAEDALQSRSLLYEKERYHQASALQKSVRGSDPDGAVYWLTRMLERGEDPLYIARRIMVMASEDIGIADSQALLVAVAAQQVVQFVGMPEAVLALTQAVVYLACAPKSNSLGRAYAKASQDVQSACNEPVPLHLRNIPAALMHTSKDSYVYAHDVYAGLSADPCDPLRPPPQLVQPQGYLPESLRSHQYYEPGEHAQGAEASIAQWLARRRVT